MQQEAQDDRASLNYHDLLIEIRKEQSSDQTKWNALYERLSKAMFGDFIVWAELLVQDLTSKKYRINIIEVEDVLNDALLKIHNNITSYRGTCNEQARSWIQTIVKRAVQDNARKVGRRVKWWQPFYESIKKLWQKNTDCERTEE